MSDLASIITALEERRALRQHVVVAVAGFAGSGKSTLARAVVDAVPDAVRLPGDDFLDPVRSRERTDDWGCVDRRRLRDDALVPFRDGRTVHHRALDWDTGRLGPSVRLPPAAVLVLDVVGIPHPDLAGLLDLTVWVDVDPATALRRGMARDREHGEDHDRLWTEVWSPNDYVFAQVFDPRSRSDLRYVPDDTR